MQFIAWKKQWIGFRFAVNFMGSNEKNRDPFEKLNLEVWASTLQSIASQTRKNATPGVQYPL